MEENGEIAKFYSGKYIFITGSSGFMGVVLLEKLLRSCPGVAAIYLLIRPKRGKNIEERIEEMLSGVLYDDLRRVRGQSLRKCIVPIVGDISKPDLNISQEDRLLLTSKVEIIFHNAANATFNKPLKIMTNTNIRGTKCVVDLAKECRNLQAFVHVSTAYSNCLQTGCVEEKFYEPAADPERLMEIVDKTDERTLEIMTAKIIGNYPNTYIFTKQVAENLINNCGLPSCVFRPSIVVSSYYEPLPGWCNNLNGLPGLMIAIGTGILHAFYVDGNMNVDIIPVDMSINALVACAWEVANQKTKSTIDDEYDLTNHDISTTSILTEQNYISSKEDTGLSQEEQQFSTPKVYNYVSCKNPITFKELLDKSTEVGQHYPSIKTVWYYAITLISNRYMYLWLTFLQHFLPAFFVDSYLYIKGKKPIAFDFYKKVFLTIDSLSLLYQREWKFGTDNTKSLNERLSAVDRSAFPMDIETVNWDTFAKHLIIGLRVIVIGEDLSTVPAAKKRILKLKIAHYTLVSVMYMLLAWVLWAMLRSRLF